MSNEFLENDSEDETDSIKSTLQSISNFSVRNRFNTSGLKNRRNFTTLLNRSNRVQTNLSNLPNFGNKEPEKITLILHPAEEGKFFATRKIEIFDGKEILIGRNIHGITMEQISNGIFDCRVLSRKHATIWSKNGNIFVMDLNSSNGTYINSEALQAQKPFQLKNGDTVQFGQVRFFHKKTFYITQ